MNVDKTEVLLRYEQSNHGACHRGSICIDMHGSLDNSVIVALLTAHSRHVQIGIMPDG